MVKYVDEILYIMLFFKIVLLRWCVLRVDSTCLYWEGEGFTGM